MIDQKLFIKDNSKQVTLKELTTLRQAFVAASLIIIVAFVLAHYFDPAFRFLALLPAFGLLLSGLTGFCPMIMILQKLPWNKQ